MSRCKLWEYYTGIVEFTTDLQVMLRRVKDLTNRKYFTMEQLKNIVAFYDWCTVTYTDREICFSGIFPRGDKRIVLYVCLDSMKVKERYRLCKAELEKAFDNLIRVYNKRAKEARDLFEVYEEAFETKEKYNRLMWLYGDMMDIFVRQDSREDVMILPEGC